MFKLNIKPIPVDFTKPWWYLIAQQKWLFLIVFTAVTILQIIWSLVPFIIAKLFEIQSYMLCLMAFVAWFCLDLFFSMLRSAFNTKFQLQCIYSIYESAYGYLLSVDPHYHIYRSSGAVIAKIDRGARGYEDFADYVTFEMTPLLVGLLTVIVSLAYFSIVLSGVMTFFIIVILYAGYYVAQHKCQLKEKEFIKQDDIFKSMTLENLTQIQLIRATFATNFRNKLLHDDIIQNIDAEARLWLSYGRLFISMGLLYIFSLFVLACILLWYIKTQSIAATEALGLFLVYTQSSKEMVKFSRLVRKTNKNRVAIKDLFNFIPQFGKQTFPVFGPSTELVDGKETISIHAQNIYFDYGKATLFNGHTFTLICSKRKESKLYGIIGPSGSGKTTFLSILGGQLKPINGTVLINDLDMYAVNDATRSHLIALQGQVATSMRGTVRENLLLGLAGNSSYVDADLLNVLEQVGLLPILDQHRGLDTLLGEGGLNFSGGQRQRLNFASLYLRAHYYKPLVVLIDEPTSSLDEISEAAITSMIQQLSQHSITLVVAHRLKTIEHAIGIIDLSLLKQEKTINVYSAADLYDHSKYYQELMHGKIQLDT